MNILLLWDRIGDYHRIRAEELKKYHTGQVFTADLGGSDQLYQWESTRHEHHFQLSPRPVQQFDFWRRLVRLHRIIRHYEIQTIGLAGYGRPEYLAILLIARLRGIQIILFAESWYPSLFVIDLLKGWLLRTTVNGFLVSGLRARDHFHQRLGLPAAKIRTGYSVVDNQHFGQSALGSFERPVLLCIARFAPEKNLMALINAFKASVVSKNWLLKLVGGGSLKEELKKLSGDQPNIQLKDWVDYQQLPALIQLSTALVLPSTFEPWGLVVNEAMAAGKPVLVSKQCGCQPDLVDATNGFVFDAHNQEEFIDTLNQLDTITPEKLQQMGKVSRRKIAGYTAKVWAERFLELIDE